VRHYAAIALAISSSMVYHMLLKVTPEGVHPVLSLTVTYATAALVCGALLLFVPPEVGVADAIKQLNWASYVLALALVGLEMGFLLAYRGGWRLGIAAVVVTVTVAVLAVPIGVLVFKEKTSLVNVAGVLVAVIGLAMMNAKG
jgi:drug/metabolite transporter (DMT)-like permease